MPEPRIRKKSRLRLLHQYYSYTGFYGFLGSSLLKAVPVLLGFVAVLLGIHFFVIDINVLLTKMTNTFPAFGIMTVFFLSESLLGLIPPEIFIAWSSKSYNPMFYLSLLAFLSYAGGVVSYYIGKSLTTVPSIKEYLEIKMAKNIRNTRKWGGFLIIVGALLPIPYSLTCMAAGIIKYPLGSLLLFGTLRFLRFYLYALAIFNIVS